MGYQKRNKFLLKLYIIDIVVASQRVINLNIGFFSVHSSIKLVTSFNS